MDSNADSVQYKSEEILICGKAENKLLKNTPHLPNLVGYVKNLAWEYEHEVRVLATVDEYGKRHTPSKSTGLTVKGNKKRAEKMLSVARAAKEAELEARANERPRWHDSFYCVPARLAGNDEKRMWRKPPTGRM